MITAMDEATKTVVTEAVVEPQVENPLKDEPRPEPVKTSPPPKEKTPPPREPTPPPPPQPFAYWLDSGKPLFQEQFDPNTMKIDAQPDTSGALTMWVSWKPKVPPTPPPKQEPSRPPTSNRPPSTIQPPVPMPPQKPPSTAGSYKPYYAGSDMGTIVTKPPSHSRPPTQSQKPPSRPATQQYRPPTNQYRPASEPPPTAQSEMHDQLQVKSSYQTNIVTYENFKIRN